MQGNDGPKEHVQGQICGNSKLKTPMCARTRGRSKAKWKMEDGVMTWTEIRDIEAKRWETDVECARREDGVAITWTTDQTNVTMRCK